MVSHEQIAKYVEEQKNALSPSTARSTRYTLQGVAAQLDGNPETLWSYLTKNQGAYTRVTTWTRVSKFWDWLQEGKGDGQRNPYSDWRKRNARSFRHTYVRRPAQITFSDAKARLKRLSDPAARKKALELLFSGMRLTESGTYENGVVVGKGGKRREVLSMPHVEGPAFDKSDMTFRRRLHAVGLKPHDLRKILANHLHKKGGLTEFDLCETFGWEDIDTARSYISAVKRDKRKEKIWEALDDHENLP